MPFPLLALRKPLHKVLLCGPMGNMHSRRNSCVVTFCGMPIVVTNEK